MSVLERAASFFLEPAAPAPARESVHDAPPVAAVLGRRGEAEPAAAALAHALRRREGARAAVIATFPPPGARAVAGEIADPFAATARPASGWAAAFPGQVTVESSPFPGQMTGSPRTVPAQGADASLSIAGVAAGGSTAVAAGGSTAVVGGSTAVAAAAARRLADRLDARGLDASARGRLAWVRLPAGEGQAIAAAQRAATVGVPLVLVLAGPRTTALDAALADADLLVLVTGEPDGPLATLARADLGRAAAPVVVVPPLTGAARFLAAFLPPPGVRRLVSREGR